MRGNAVRDSRGGASKDLLYARCNYLLDALEIARSDTEAPHLDHAACNDPGSWPVWPPTFSVQQQLNRLAARLRLPLIGWLLLPVHF